MSDSVLVWERPEPSSRPGPGALSRARIVRAALKLAGAGGLASVSLRKVAAALKVRPTRLHRYLSTQEELLNLMVDAVYGELVSEGPIRGEWREALRSIAHRTRQAAAKHPWLIDLPVGPSSGSPNVLAHIEASLAALSDTPGFGDDIDAVLNAVGTVNAYVVGALQSEANERASLESREWQNTVGPYLHRMLATGRFPTLTRASRDASDTSYEVVFDKGLDCVLDGIAARLKR
ncbi:TetR/AcrR family transcriptional regulator C-terminal domain-containing protein [Corallococcus sp. bb12-1]|uniref:TetR/AcrR family transcriptional regulator n=1 Tax=Corallococcus sp. bb12-1 TaxID=2996784 RepID=UPI00226D9CC6|nr:TetR/AcrR family transcriptional regulator C-terminal domain-containing protein [Corallococcus sp. bb12-1]MCY1044933.1 TetR/AcrR family transcriptional regulator C-terminal domain-containing protein [Corallococcus sp. bb12-1]